MYALARMMEGSRRVTVDGKFLSLDEDRFIVRGVTYGTFAPREDGALFPVERQIRSDLSAMRSAGFNTIRTYTTPPADLLEIAQEQGMHVIAGIFYPDWRYLVGEGRAGMKRIAAEAELKVRTDMRLLAGRPEVLAVCVGNEVPTDALRWVGHRKIAAVLDRLADSVHEADPEALVTYGNYPTAEYLTLDHVDVVTFNVYLERSDDLRRYLSRLQNLAGDRPMLVGELGFHAGSSPDAEEAQARVLEEQIEVALERGAAGTCVFAWTDDWHVGSHRVEGWRFGLTRSDRSPRPALARVARAQARKVGDLDWPWPSISVVVCAWNSAATIDECLSHVCGLDYPHLEVVVVDDGSTDATAEITHRHPRARLVTIPHSGLAVARNAGIAKATGELIAFIDADAYPSPEWPYYLALGMDRSDVGAVGGPNLPPGSDPVMAQAVARAPGGPAHVLLTDDRAEHIPGCNMAFWRDALIAAGGFDPIYTAAGDDVDVCWRLLDRGLAIAFHPAAVVWHHRRSGARAYLRQQRGYGHAETLVAARHPDRFNGFGAARWRGALYNGFPPLLARQPIYRGRFGTAAFQSIYRGRANNLDLIHQAGVPIALAMLPLSISPLLPIRLAGLIAVVMLGLLFAVDIAMARPPHRTAGFGLRFRVEVAALYMLQPLARLIGRLAGDEIGQAGPSTLRIAGSVARQRSTLIISTQSPREEIMEKLIRRFREARLRVVGATGWEDYDCRVLTSTLVAGDVVSSSHVPGVVQVRVRGRLRRAALAAVLVLAGAAAIAAPVASLVVLVAAAEELARGAWTNRFVLPTIVTRAVGVAHPEPTHRDTALVKEPHPVREPAQRAS